MQETGDDPEQASVAFSGIRECLPAFKKFVCAINYPPCEGTETKKVCLSYCKSFQTICGIGTGQTCAMDYPEYDHIQ